MPTPEAPLAGITIVEFGHSVAAPYAGLILADLGARVVKVENPAIGDYARGWGPPFWQGTASAFHCLNRGKEDLAVDLSDPAQAAALRHLIAEEADAVIQNLRIGVLERYGLDYEALKAANPALIWVDIGAFGAKGPLAQKPGYDPLMQAFTGVMSVTGEHGRPPVRVGVSMVDMGSGMWAVIGLLTQLLARAKSGQGGRIATSLFETGLAWMSLPLAGYAANGEVRRPYGSGIAEICPYQAFASSDGLLMIAAGNDNLFRRFMQVLGRGELGTQAEFASNGDRVVNRERLVALIEERTRTFTTVALAAALDAVGVPNAPIHSIDQVIDDPQTAASGMIQATPDGLRSVGIPLSFDGVRPRSRTSAPALGADNVLLHSTTKAAE
ncbi:MAG: CoA transferase [Variibacter sp.]|nr:CoA transferase [Variibacter sp.]